MIFTFLLFIKTFSCCNVSTVAFGLYEQQEFQQGMQKVSFKVEIKSPCLSIIAKGSSVCLLMLKTTSLQIIFISLHFAKSNLQSTFTNEKNCKSSRFTNINKFILDMFRALLFKSRFSDKLSVLCVKCCTK